ncbi:DNA polymerase III subunit delta [Candidatus Margulisiibacteriota bacterium]
MIYLLLGDEKFLIDEEVKRLKGKYKDLSLERFDEIPQKELAESLNTPALFAPFRLILAYRVDFAADEDVLYKSIEKLDAGNELVLVSPKNLNKRKKIYKLIESIGEVKEFKSFTDWEINQVAAWVVGRVGEAAKKISLAAAQLLVEISGKNLLTLSLEIEKLIAYGGDKITIREADILKLASKKEMHVFSFTDALKEKKIKLALALQEKIVKNKEPVVPLIALLASQFKVLLLVKLLSQQGLRGAEIARRLGASPYYIKKCLNQAAKYSHNQLRAVMFYLYQADLRLKRGEAAKVVLPLVIADICHG